MIFQIPFKLVSRVGEAHLFLCYFICPDKETNVNVCGVCGRGGPSCPATLDTRLAVGSDGVTR